MELRNGALNHRTVGEAPEGVTTFALTRRSLIALVTGELDLAAARGDGTVRVKGNPSVLGRLIAVLSPGDPDFAIVSP